MHIGADKKRIQPESIKLFIEGQAFSQSYDSAPCPSPPPSYVSKLDRRYTGRLRKRDNMQSGEMGRGGWASERLVVLAIVSSGALRKICWFVDPDLMVQDPGCLLAGVPNLHVIVQVLRQKICIILRSLMVKKTMPIYMRLHRDTY